MKAVFSVACLAAASAILQGAPVNVVCSAPLSSSVTASGANAASCTSLSNGSSWASGGASATASVNLQLASNPADFSSLSTYQYAYARQGPRQSDAALFGPPAADSVSIAFTDTLITAGSVRSGYVQIQGYGYGAYFYDGGATMTSGLLLNGSSYPATEVTCYSNVSYCSPGSGYYNFYSLIPVTLGTSLTIEANGHTNNSASFFDGLSGGSLTTTYNFRFFEADGRTPVAVSQTPEPATLGLIGASLAGLAIVRRRRSA